MELYQNFKLENNREYKFSIENENLNIQTTSAPFYTLDFWKYYYQYGTNFLPFFGVTVNQKTLVEDTRDHLLIPNILETEKVGNEIKLQFDTPQNLNNYYEDVAGVVIENMNNVEIENYCYFSFENTETKPMKLTHAKYSYKYQYDENRPYSTTEFELKDETVYCNLWKEVYDRWDSFVSLKQYSLLPYYLQGTIKIGGDAKINKLITNGKEQLENLRYMELTGEFKEFEQINDNTGRFLKFKYKNQDTTEFKTIQVYLENNQFPQVYSIKSCKKLEYDLKISTVHGNGDSDDRFILYYNKTQKIIRTPHSDTMGLHILRLEPVHENEVFDIQLYTDIKFAAGQKEKIKLYLLNSSLLRSSSNLTVEENLITLSSSEKQITLKDTRTNKEYTSFTNELKLIYLEGYKDGLIIEGNECISPNGYFLIQENITKNLREGSIIMIQPSEDNNNYRIKINNNILNFSKIQPIILKLDELETEFQIENMQNSFIKINLMVMIELEGVKEVNNNMRQYYFNPVPNHYTINLDLNTYTKIGIQALPGAQIYFNGKSEPVVINNTGIFEIDLKNYGYINQIAYDGTNVISGPTPYLIVDISR